MTALDGSLGIGVETVYGTAVVPSRFYPVTSGAWELNPIELDDASIMGGGFGARGSAHVRTGTAPSGTLEMEVVTKQMALLLQHVTGTVPTPVATGTGGFTYTMPLTRNTGRYLTVQTGLPDEAVTQPLTASGVKVLSGGFSCEIDGKLMMSLDLDAKSLVDSIALTTPSYATGMAPYHWDQMSLSIGTFGSEAPVDGVKGVSVDFERPLFTDNRYANGKSEPRLNGRPTVSGSLDVDFLDKAEFFDRFMDGTAFSLVWEFLATAGTGYTETFRIALPKCYFTGELPTLEGEDLLGMSMPFVALRDDVASREMATITYISTDAAA